MASASRVQTLVRGARKPRTFRCISLTAAAAILMLFVFSTRCSTSACYTTRSGTSLQVTLYPGNVQLWWNSRQFYEWLAVDHEVTTYTPGLSTSFEWHDYQTADLAWRPYHIARSSFPRASNYHGLAIPLWIALVPALLLAGYSHGLVVAAPWDRQDVSAAR